MAVTKPAVKRAKHVVLDMHVGDFAVSGFGHLTDPGMQPAMDKLKERIASDPDFAKSLLESAGIVNARGKLTKRFGG